MKTEFSRFQGVRPRLNPALIGPNVAQDARNCLFSSADLRSLKGPTPIVTPAPLGDVIRTIYRIGQDLPETQFWLTWSTDVDVVRGPVFGDVSERTYFTGDGFPKVTTLQLATQGGDRYPVNARRLGVPRPVSAPRTVPSSTTSPLETRAYIYTFVSELGEEGAPSPARLVDVTEGGTVVVSAMDTAPPAEGYVFVAKRLYRSAQTTGETAIYRFVAEIPIGQDTYVDIVANVDLNEQLSTDDYDPPPDNLTGIIALPGGFLAGFVGRDLYFSEPFRPYAWPTKYSVTVDDPIVGLGVYGSSLFVGTTGLPVIYSGNHPDAMSPELVEVDHACVAKRSIVSVPGGVVYATNEGLAYVGMGGTRMLTDMHFTKREWAAIQPSTIRAHYSDGRYIATCGAGGFILDGLTDGEFTYFDSTATAGYREELTDTLYLAIGGVITSFNTGEPLTYTWKSRKVQHTGYPSPAWCRVDADAYPVTFTLTATLEAKGADAAETRTYTKTVQNHRPFRLPTFNRPREIEVTLTGTKPIRYCGMADSGEEFGIG